MENRFFILAGSLLGAIAVILGALGAHALKSKLGPDQLASFETGVKYQLYHAILLIIIYLLQKSNPSPLLNTAGYLVLAGVLCFSVSIYFLSTRSILGMEGQLKFLGPVTPIGGVLMISGWLVLMYSYLAKN